MDAEEYDLEYFRANGFNRRKCRKCGSFFWTLGDSELCGEPPCVEYTFLGNSPMSRRGDAHQMRELFLSFMEGKGHRRINRYPIVARWRDDVFFVQASIYDFQPWVISGAVKPPANPLTMSQPCVRFNDIDNVGKTGRHFTLFEMMTHTAFNTSEEWHYFKDGTVELCQEYFVKELGVDEHLLTYKEAEWAGGGNAGPCFEVLIKGAEVATLVFMMYREENGRRTKMPMQIVDTGYGLERIAWVSQGSPSAYEAVFGDMLEELKEELDVQTDEKLLSEYSRVAGLMDAKTPGAIREIRGTVAKNMNVPLQQLLSMLLPLENLYTALDHTRALAFMLHDGVMPSNAREGYFARLLIRRGIRALSVLGNRVDLVSLVERQIEYWGRDFPELREEKEDILKTVSYEEKKFQETISRGRALVQRMEKSGRIDEEKLIELYESHGLTPEQVAEFSSSTIEIPEDFYAKVAAKHSAAEAKKEEKGVALPELPATERLYYEDQYRTEFDATVLFSDERHVVLDRTCFYPEGGGQDPDKGYIAGRRVDDVQLQGNVIVHTFEGRPFRVGERVKCSVDRNRRLDLMRHHTATHILLAACRRVLGNHVWQAGAHKQQEEARLDITHYAPLSQEEIASIEERANTVVMENRAITVEVMERTKAESLYGFRLYQGGVVPGREIRVVTVDEWDLEACAGTHCERTGELGLIKIKGAQRIQDGVIRLTFVAGTQALKLFQYYEGIIQKMKELLNTDEAHLVEALKKRQMEAQELQKKLELTEGQRVQELASLLKQHAVKRDSVLYIIESVDLDDRNIRALLRMLSDSKEPLIAILLNNEKVSIARSSGGPACNEVLREINRKIGGKGGGSEDFAQGTVRAGIEKIRAAVLGNQYPEA